MAASPAHCDELGDMRLLQETREIFYHGFDGYMKYAFPEDELRPISCAPLTRDRGNPGHIELNDALGNYSLTLVDSLSTLAILASGHNDDGKANRALDEFQNGVKSLIEYYGDGTEGAGGVGRRARGFDLDSKVQVFETVIRGVGGLLSAHLFAQGDLPIEGYQPVRIETRGKEGIAWRNGVVYDGQLLRLARDLAERLLPAFHTATGLPYPRVNLRTGVPFYPNSPFNNDPYSGQCPTSQQSGNAEITETCSAGAGSLVLELTTLSRLTGDDRFEEAGKRAFWSVWHRRSTIGLIGSGIDAETGQWVSPWTGIGAGVDSFFEYAFKSHILLSGLSYDETRKSSQSPEAFLGVWQEAHAAIKRHVFRGEVQQQPHYLQVDIHTGALRASWVDSLSAYFQGLLTLAGELEEAQATHLLHTALWTRYSALPERWSVMSGNIESGLRWWGGRPEFIESTWYLYRATKDPWYLHVGEMTLRDIKRRCWTKCGWAGLQDVRTGEQMDRMESFFLGETAKYLYLLFDPEHPLNHLDGNWVFTTEGHPLIIPKRFRKTSGYRNLGPRARALLRRDTINEDICPLPPSPIPLTFSATAARGDLWHAANLARLHLAPTTDTTLDSPLVEFSSDHPSITLSDVRSPSNYSYYPWTLPPEYIPPYATCQKMASRTTFDLSFPNLPEQPTGLGGLQRVLEGILVNSMSGLRLGMIKEAASRGFSGGPESGKLADLFRIYAISSVALGRDEKVFVKRSLVGNFNPVDPYFSRVKDMQVAELLVDVPTETMFLTPDDTDENHDETNNFTLPQATTESPAGLHATDEPSMLSALLSNIQSVLKETWPTTPDSPLNLPPLTRHVVAATLPIGPGAAPLPDIDEPANLDDDSASSPLPWTTIHVHDSPLCDEQLSAHIARAHQVLVIRRGGCSFSEKLRNIPPFPPSPTSLQLVVVISGAEGAEQQQPNADHPDANTEENLAQPYLDEPQLTPAGLPRPSPIPLVLVDGGDETFALFRHAAMAAAAAATVVRRERGEGAQRGSSQQQQRAVHDTEGGNDEAEQRGGDEQHTATAAVGVRRRWYYETMGVRIGNLIVL